MLRCIAFDVVGTLIFADPPVHMAYHRIGKKFGSQLDPIAIRQSFRDALSRREGAVEGVNDVLGDTLAIADGGGHSTSEEAELQFWRDVVCEVLPDVEDKEACFAALFEHFAQPASWSRFMDVDEVLPVLRDRGFTLAMASNFDSRLHAVCKGHATLDLIDRRVISSEIGHRKPARAFFEALIRTCGCEPSEMLMVGDHAQHDVEAARDCGLQAVHLDRSGTAGPVAIASLDELFEKIPELRS
jgi:putative hydrolase of the HAD superfamily